MRNCLTKKKSKTANAFFVGMAITWDNDNNLEDLTLK